MRMRWSIGNAGEIAVGPLRGTDVEKVAPLSDDTWSPLGPVAKIRRSVGKFGGRRTVPPEKPDAFRCSHVVPPSAEWKSTAHGAETQPWADVPAA